MNTEKIAGSPSFPFGIGFWTIACVSLCAASLATGNVHYLLAAVPALALAAALMASRPKPFECELTPAGLRLATPPADIPYASMESLTLAGMPQDPCDLHASALRSGPIVLVHRDGVLEIPARLNVSPRELYKRLLDRIPTNGSRAIPAALDDYVRSEETAFGRDRIRTYAARAQLGRRPSTHRARACCLALIAAGIFWVTTPLFLDREPGPWVAGGSITAFLAAIFWLAYMRQGRHPDARIRRRREAGLVISPSGIAMVQGDARGRMRWDELREIRMSKRVWFSAWNAREQAPGGIQLIMAGATIRIADLYERPLPIIAKMLLQYWRVPSRE